MWELVSLTFINWGIPPAKLQGHSLVFPLSDACPCCQQSRAAAGGSWQQWHFSWTQPAATYPEVKERELRFPPASWLKSLHPSPVSAFTLCLCVVGVSTDSSRAFCATGNACLYVCAARCDADASLSWIHTVSCSLGFLLDPL